MEEENIKTDESQAENKNDLGMASLGSLTSPEALVMFTVAGILDGIGYILLFFALDDFWILDVIGFLIIGGWMYFRSGSINTPQKNKEKGKEIVKRTIQRFQKQPASKSTKGKKGPTGRKIGKRLGWSTGIEALPYIGDISPSWILAVYFELKNNPS